MRIYIILGIIFFLGPTCNHRVLCEPSDDEGSGDDEGFYWADKTEGSARGPGPYGADYDYIVPDDTEPDFEDDNTFDPYNYEEEIEGSGIGTNEDNVWFDDGDDDFVEVKPVDAFNNAAVPDYFEPEGTEVGEEEIIVEEEQPTDISRNEIEPDFTETEDKEDIVEPPSVTSTSLPTEMSGMEEEHVVIQSKNEAERPVSVFAQPGILAAFIGGAVVGLLCAILLVMFIVYRMRKKDEGSYPLDEPKRMPLTSSYSPNDKEIYA